jgi:hypothetical protein
MYYDVESDVERTSREGFGKSPKLARKDTHTRIDKEVRSLYYGD